MEKSAQSTIGKAHESPPCPLNTRDAVHVAVVLKYASYPMHSGESYENGIVDPFLERDIVNSGEFFWLFMFPNSTGPVRHTWEEIEKPPKKKPEVRPPTPQDYVGEVLAYLFSTPLYNESEISDALKEYYIKGTVITEYVPTENTTDIDWHCFWEQFRDKHGLESDLDYFCCEGDSEKFNPAGYSLYNRKIKKWYNATGNPFVEEGLAKEIEDNEGY